MTGRPSDDEDLDAAVADLARRASALLAQHGHALPPDLLDTIIDALSSATSTSGLSPGVAADASVTLGFALKSRYTAQVRRTSSTADIDRSIAIYRAAVTREGANYPLLSNLAQAYLGRSIKVHDVDTARNAVTTCAYALDAVSAADPHFAAAVASATSMLDLPLVDYPGDVGLETLTESLLRARRITPRGSRSELECARALHDAGERLLIRYVDGGPPAQLELAVAALTAASAGPAAGASVFVTLGLAFSQRGALRGPGRDGEDVDASVTAMRRAMRLATTGGERDEYAAHLVAFLVHRFETSRQREDLDEAVMLGIQVRAGEADSAAKEFCTPLLEKALSLRAQLDGNSFDARSAFVLRRSDPQLTALGDDDQRDDRPQGTLKKIFREPYAALASKRRQHTHPDLELVAETDQEIDRLIRALPGAAADTTRAQIREALVDALAGRHIARPEAHVLDELIAQSARLIAELPPADFEHRAGHRLELAQELLERHDVGDHPADLDAVAEQLRPVRDDERLATGPRFAAAVLLGQAAARGGHWPGAAEAFGGAVDLLPMFAGRHLEPDDHLREVAGWSEIASDAAAAAVRAGAVEHALELLERGRGLLLGRALDYRETFEHVRAADPEKGPPLIDELSRLGTALAAPLPGGPGGVDRRRATVGAWNRTVDSIRRLPGCGDFLAPVTVHELHPAASGGPVVTVNISRYGSHALVLNGTTVEAVPLPGATVEAVREQETAFFGALPFAELSPADPEATHESQEPLREVLAWLWTAVAEPVLAHLGRSGPVPSRIWWVPTGNLAALPLHAAGLGDDRSVLDLTVSSYAATVTSLARAGRRSDPPTSGDVHLIAAGPSSLAGATAEVDRLVEHFPDAYRILGADATRARVAAALRTSRWLHIACHATSYWNAPARSALHLHDGPLTVRDLLADRAPRGELVYLSACETVLSSTVAAAEVMHLGTAFHVAGYRQVIGTLWRVTDGTAAETARLFYGRLGSPPQAARAARALHETARELRRRYPGLPTRWAAHVHIGP